MRLPRLRRVGLSRSLSSIWPWRARSDTWRRRRAMKASIKSFFAEVRPFRQPSLSRLMRLLDGGKTSATLCLTMPFSRTWYPNLRAAFPPNEPLAGLMARLLVLLSDSRFEYAGISEDQGFERLDELGVED